MNNEMWPRAVRIYQNNFLPVWNNFSIRLKKFKIDFKFL